MAGQGCEVVHVREKQKWPTKVTTHCRQHLSDFTGLRVPLLAGDFEELGGDSGGGETRLSTGTAASVGHAAVLNEDTAGSYTPGSDTDRETRRLLCLKSGGRRKSKLQSQ